MSSQSYAEKKVLVLGSCFAAIGLAKYMVGQGAFVTLIDPAAPVDAQGVITARMGNLPVQVICGELSSQHLEGIEMILIASSFKLSPMLLSQLQATGSQVVGELDFVSQKVQGKYIAVAGTNGKSTTASVIKLGLEKMGHKVFASIDRPLSELLLSEEKYDYHLVVADVQLLDTQRHFRPDYIVMLNMAEEKLDAYSDFEEYLTVHRRLLQFVDEESTLILNSQDLHIVSFVQGLQGRTLFFGAQEVPDGFEGAWANRQALNVNLRDESGTQSFHLKNLRLRGGHNRDNLMAAGLCLLSMGLPKEKFQECIDEIKALPNRMQFVKRINAVAFYNDSASTNVSAVHRSLQSFQEPVILIMGGKDTDANFASLGPIVRLKVKDLILVGDTKEKINRAIGDFTETFIVGTTDEAILIAYQKSRSGDVVIMSPGCEASTDFHGSLEARGEFFRDKVVYLSQPRKRNVI